MAKNDFIHNTINDFREKIDTALKGDNAGADISRAVQELLTEINAKYPQAALSTNLMPDNSRKNTGDIKARKLPINETTNIPGGVQYMLNNLAAHKQE